MGKPATDAWRFTITPGGQQINSPRCLALLRRLAGELRGRKVNPHIREFSTELDHRLKLVA